MKKTLFVAVLAILAITNVKAQTLPTPRIEWDYVAETIANVNTYTQVATLDGTVITAPKVCSQAGANVICYVPITALTPGTHTITVTASRNGQTSTGNATINTANGPKTPGGFRYIINVTINVPE